MIRVCASADGIRWEVYEHPTANGWDNDERGNLDISRAAGDIIASYRDGTWFRVWEEADPQVDDRDPQSAACANQWPRL